MEGVLPPLLRRNTLRAKDARADQAWQFGEDRLETTNNALEYANPGSQCSVDIRLDRTLDKQDGVDLDMLVSLDRIDSNGHYEIGNMQLVCRFVNYWKSSQDNGRFLELLDLIIERRMLC